MSSNNRFAFDIINWYSANKRDLPWRNTNNPYFIWLSEIILQQTRVEQGFNYYLRFTETFPTIASLANAHEDEVLKLWEGLGYYSRARNLHFAAKQIMQDFQGVFPSDYHNILKLKGIGKYTAAAIGSFAFSLPYPTIDGNVYRVLSRLLTEPTPINSSAAPKIFENIVSTYFDAKKPGDFNQAMMELGALICTPTKPKCSICPVREYCMAFETKTMEQFPIKNKTQKNKEIYLYFLVILHENSLLIEQRKENGIWKKLYQFPLIEKETVLNHEELLAEISAFFGQTPFIINKIKPSFVHLLTHRKLHITLVEINSVNNTHHKNYMKVEIGELKKYSFPIALRNYINKEFC